MSNKASVRNIIYGIDYSNLRYVIEECLKNPNYRAVIVMPSLRDIDGLLKYIAHFYHKICSRIVNNPNEHYFELENKSLIRAVHESTIGHGMRTNLVLVDDFCDSELIETVFKPFIVKY